MLSAFIYAGLEWRSSPFSTWRFCSREQAKSECDWLVMSSVFVASQSSCFFLCSREQIRLVENRRQTVPDQYRCIAETVAGSVYTQDACTQGVSQGFKIGRPERFCGRGPTFSWAWSHKKHVFWGVAAIFCYGIVVLLFVEPLCEIYR